MKVCGGDELAADIMKGAGIQNGVSYHAAGQEGRADTELRGILKTY